MAKKQPVKGAKPAPKIPPAKITPPKNIKGIPSPAGRIGAAGMGASIMAGAAPRTRTGNLGTRGNSISLSEAVRAVQYPESNSPETRKYYTMKQTERETVWLVEAAGGDKAFLFAQEDDPEPDDWRNGYDEFLPEEEQRHTILSGQYRLRDSNDFIAFAAEANGGFVDPRWYRMRDQELRAEVNPTIATFPARNPRDWDREGWWSTQRGGGYSLGLAYYQFFVEFNQGVRGDNVAVAVYSNVAAEVLGYIALNAPRYAAQVVADGPLPFGDVVTAIELVLLIATTIGQRDEVQVLESEDIEDSRHQCTITCYYSGPQTCSTIFRLSFPVRHCNQCTGENSLCDGSLEGQAARRGGCNPKHHHHICE